MYTTKIKCIVLLFSLISLELMGVSANLAEIKKLNPELQSNTDSILAELNYLYSSTYESNSMYTNGVIKEYIGSIHYAKKQWKSALYYYSQAQIYFDESDSVLKQGKTRNMLGKIYNILHEYDNAIRELYASVDICLENNDTLNLISNYIYISEIFLVLKQNTKADKYISQGLEFANTSVKYKEYKAQLLANKALLLKTTGKYDQALDIYHEAIGLLRKDEKILTIADLYNNIGVIFELKQNFDSTYYYYNKANQIHVKVGDKAGVAHSSSNLANCFINKGNYREALNWLYKSQKIAVEREMLETRVRNHYNISYCYKMLLDYNKAILHLDSSYYLKDNLFNTEIARQFAELDALYQNEKKENEILTLEKQRVKQRNLNVLLVFISILSFMLIVFLLFFFKLKNKSDLTKALNKEQTKRFKAVIEAQEEERKRIAGELHDSVGPLLSVTQLYISDLADQYNGKDSEEEELFSRSLKILDDACNETRNISHNLMPGVLIRSGLISALRELCTNLRASNKYTVNFDSNMIKERFGESIEITNYRICQELVNNIIKHSNASEISISINKENGFLNCEIKDNGSGFDVNKLSTNSGIGWKSIYSRISLINGSVDVKSGRSGTKIRIISPLD